MGGKRLRDLRIGYMALIRMGDTLVAFSALGAGS